MKIIGQMADQVMSILICPFNMYCLLLNLKEGSFILFGGLKTAIPLKRNTGSKIKASIYKIF